MRTDLGLLALLSAVLGLSCGPTPSAPHLRRDDPVFQSDAEGIRFLAPEGWQQRVRGEAPPGKVEKERTLIEYRPADGASQSLLRVSLIDLPPEADPVAHLVGSSYQVKKWNPTGKTEPAKIGPQDGTRYTFTGLAGRVTLTKEVVAVRRGGRMYFFTVLYEPKDADARAQLRRVVGSVIWKG